MNEMTNDAMGFASIGLTGALVIMSLIAWFFINRASVRANEQTRLLEALLDEQKKQNVILRRLADSVTGGEKNKKQEEAENRDFTRLIPER